MQGMSIMIISQLQTFQDVFSKAVFAYCDWYNWKIWSAVIIIFIFYRLLWFENECKKLSDAGYDHLDRVYKGNKKAKAAAVEESRKKRDVGDIPPVYPNGWFVLLDSDEVKSGQVKHVSALGEDFAVFRGENGIINILSAICPHLGANVAIGGTVSGNCIECPFHGWKFDGLNGKCVSIPYSQTIPSEATLKRWISYELNTFIYVWYHAENEEPTWYPKSIPEIGYRTWICCGRVKYEINAHIQDITENGTDKSHFDKVHRSVNLKKWWPWILDSKYESKSEPGITQAEKHILFISAKMSNHLFNMHFVAEGKGHFEGPALQTIHNTTSFGNSLVCLNLTPIEPMLLKVAIKTSCPLSSLLTAKIIYHGIMAVYEQDLPIWNNKKYVKKPLLTKEEDSIKKYHRWYSQFYTEHSPTLKKNVLDW